MSSSLHLELFERPRFRDNVELFFDDEGADCVYRDQSCRMNFHGQQDARQLLKLLVDGGRTREELQEACPAVAGEVGDVLTALDALGLLTETMLAPPRGVVSGRQLYRDLRRMADSLHNQVVEESFYQKMAGGTITRDQLVGYALEYYHLVHQAPRLLASALSKEEPGRVPGLLQEFFASELHHDRMLEASLGAVGITREQLLQTQPLPTTFGLCAAIGAYSALNPLTFKAMLYLFEETSPDFNEAFAAASRSAGLPERFISPILAHARLNDDGGHGDISAGLLAEVAVVGPEEQHMVRKHLAITVETMALQEAELLAYYGSPGAVIPRVFS